MPPSGGGDGGGGSVGATTLLLPTAATALVDLQFAWAEHFAAIEQNIFVDLFVFVLQSVEFLVFRLNSVCLALLLTKERNDPSVGQQW